MIIKFASKIVAKIGHVFIKISETIYKNFSLASWFKNNGDQTYRLDYDLNEKSLVFDVGGYEGQWASDIFSKYCCKIYIFEPVPQFADKIKDRFSKNKNITVYGFGLSNKTCHGKISIERDSSSIFKKSSNMQSIKLIRAIDFIQENNISKIDLIKINIEGAEYDLLEHLIECGFIKNIHDIQIQFHGFIPNAEERMAKIQNELTKTHYLTFQYPFVWENWRIKNKYE